MMAIFRFQRTLGAAIAACVCWSHGGPAAADFGLLLLKNGSQLNGEVSRIGENYEVRDGGATFEISGDEVVRMCRDLGEAYRWKREQIHPRDDRGLARLVSWSLTQGLLREAEADLASLMAKYPRDPELRRLSRRLEVEKANSPANDLDASDPIQDSIPEPRKMERPPRATPARPPNAASDSVSPESMEEFVRRVQPLMLNRCATAACHGDTRHSFSMTKPRRREISALDSQANLASVLAVVDTKHWESSPLLTAHNSDTGIAGIGHLSEAQRTLLIDWMRMIATDARTGDASPPKSAQARPRSGPLPGEWRADNSAEGAEDFSAAGDDATAGATTDDSSEVDSAPAFVPRDPFDPDIFNRRYFPERFGQGE